MPELPDVEVFRRYLEATSLHKRVKEVQVHSRNMVEGAPVWKLRATLEGHAFQSTERHGKYMFAALDNTHSLVLHFGMTGFLKYFKDLEKNPPHERMLLSFYNGYHLAYDCQRKLGKISLTEDLEAFISEEKLGSDALDKEFDLEAFRGVLSVSRSTVKSALMNQSLVAGIGNIYSDEIVFQAGIHPKAKAQDLNDKATERLFQSMKDVLNTAIDSGAKPQELPDTYIIPRRKKSGKCPRCGNVLKK
ncbi:MAG: DNA-formamidopyrimidine glycosylase family protein, partial [Deltaproteobacteria bacterium]